MDDIAKACGLSTSALQNRFSEAFNITVKRYMRKRLLERAKRALGVEGRTIGEAAYEAGYNHTSNFVSAFTREYGLPPKAYLHKLGMNRS